MASEDFRIIVDLQFCLGSKKGLCFVLISHGHETVGYYAMGLLLPNNGFDRLQAKNSDRIDAG
jgi:hypothetical protein